MSFSTKLVKSVIKGYSKVEAGEELLLLICKLKGVMPSLHTHVTSSGTAYLYMSNQPYILGRIKYGQLQDSTNDYMYGVVSPNITNEKYSDHRDLFNTKMTKNVDTALKHVKKYVRPMSLTDIARNSTNDYEHKIRSLVSSKVNAAENSKRSVMQDELMTELRTMYQTGYEFNPTLAEKIHDWIEADAEASKYQRKFKNDMSCRFVQVKNTPMGQHLSVAQCTDMLSYSTKVTPTDVFTATNAPEELVGKLSVLSILEDEGYVEDVGMKITDELFYVEG